MKNPSQIFHRGSELKLFQARVLISEEEKNKLKLKNTYIDIIPEWVLDYEVIYARNNPKLIGYIIIRDTLDLTAYTDLNKAKIEIFFTDVFDKHSHKIFNITNFKEEAGSSKTLSIQLQDSASYILENTFISKYFTGKTKVQALSQFMDELGVSDILKQQKSKVEFEADGNKTPFTIGRTENLLMAFQRLFKTIGFIMYQDREGFKVKKKSSLLPSKLEVEKAVFKDGEQNNLYKNKIFDSEVILLDKEQANKIGVEKSYGFDHKTKTMVEYNNKNYLSEVRTNKDDRDFRDTTGTKVSYRNAVEEDGYKSDVQEEMLKMSQMIISVVGLVERDINKVIEVVLQGNKSYADGEINGNVPTSGKYLVYSIIDKYFSGKYIQQLRLCRSDNQKV